jgi:hypothetical protein
MKRIYLILLLIGISACSTFQNTANKQNTDRKTATDESQMTNREWLDRFRD